MTAHPHRRPALIRALLLAAVTAASVAASSLTATTASAASSELQRAGGDLDCSDFRTQAAAQSFFNSHNPSADPHGLDADGDGVACESNPCPCSTDGPGGGGGTPPAPPPIEKEKLCGRILGAEGSRVCFRAVTRGDKLKRVKHFKFRGLPVRCQPLPDDPYAQPSTRVVTGKERKIDADGRRFASKKVKLRGNPRGLRAKVVGKVKRSGKAKGVLRARFVNGQGRLCLSGARKWKAHQ